MWEKFLSLKITSKVVIILGVLLAVVVFANYTFFVNRYSDDILEAMVKKAGSFTAVADETKDYVAKLHSTEVFKIEELIEEAQEIVAKGKDYKNSRIYKTIPIVAGWTAAEKAAKGENVIFKITSFDARNKEHEPGNDKINGKFRTQLLQDLTDQVSAGGTEVVFRVNEKQNQLHYMRAITLSKFCLTCHGNPANSPNGDGTDFLGFRMENWKVGDMHGAYEVILPLEKMDASVAGLIKNSLLVTLLLVSVGVLGFVFIFKKSITGPLQTCVRFVSSITEGDLTQEIDCNRTDEIGILAGGLKNMNLSLTKMIKEIREKSSKLNETSSSLAGVSQQVTGSADEMTDTSTTVASASEEMSVNMATISDSAEESSSNINMVATSIEEMTSTVNEISRNTGKAQQIAADAVQSVNSASDKVSKLGAAAKDIDKVVEAIMEIAEQTKLLALNATIEAARAGEAGKGFAVVATEVKELAKQTNSATEEIKVKIEAIQNSTDGTVSEISQINTVITDVSEIVSGIASAVEEQSITTKDIAQNVGQAANGINIMTSNVVAAADVAKMIASDISSVTTNSNAVKTASDNVNSNAAELTGVSDNLQSLVNKFRIK